MVALSEALLIENGFAGRFSWGALLRARIPDQVQRLVSPPALRPTIYVPMKRGETLTYAEVVARKV